MTNTSNDPRLQQEQQEANRFALDLLRNSNLMQAYYTELKKAIANYKNYEGQIMSNFLVKHGYKTNFNLVVKAQSALAMYKLYYWSGTYSTTISDLDGKNKTKGEVLAVQTYSNSPTPQISYGECDIIGAKYKNLVLSWDTAHGFNDTEGKITFKLTTTKGKAVRTFSGTITQGGQKKLFVGVLTPVHKLSEKERRKISDNQSLEGLKVTEAIVNMLAQTSFLALNLALLWKTNKELDQLKKAEKKAKEKEAEGKDAGDKDAGNKDDGDKDAGNKDDGGKDDGDKDDGDQDVNQKKIEELEDQQKAQEQNANDAVKGSEEPAEAYNKLSPEEQAQGAQEIAPPDANFPKIDEVPQVNGEEADEAEKLLGKTLKEDDYEEEEEEEEEERGSGNDEGDDGDDGDEGDDGDGDGSAAGSEEEEGSMFGNLFKETGEL